MSYPLSHCIGVESNNTNTTLSSPLWLFLCGGVPAEYQGRERDFLHREEYHITQLEDKDSHYNALVKALKDRVSNTRTHTRTRNVVDKSGLLTKYLNHWRS